MAQTAEIKITADTSQAERALGSLNNTLKALAGITIGAGVAASLVEIAGKAQELTNKLASVSDSLAEANAKFYLLSDIAMRTGTSIGATVDLYQKLAMSSTFAGSSTQSLGNITDAFNKTLIISGASAEGARSALYNFAQAVQNGTLQGNDFRAMAENNGYFLNLLSKSLGISRTELKQWSSEGKISMELVAKALENNTQLAEDFAKTTRTIPQALENLSTSFLRTVKTLDDATGASTAIVFALETLSNNLPIVTAGIVGLGVAFAAIRFEAIVGGITAIATAMGAMAVAAGPIGLAVAAVSALGTYFLMNKAIDDAKKKSDELNKSTDTGLKITHQRNQAALNVDKQLKLQIESMNAIAAVDFKSVGTKDLQLEIEKALVAEKAKYANTGETITPQLERQFRAAERNKILSQEHVAIETQMVSLKAQYTNLGIIDVDQQKIAAEMDKFRLSVTNETYMKEKDRLENQLKLNQAKEIETTYARMTAPESGSQVASRAGSIFGSTNEGVAVEAQRQQVALDALKQRGLINDQTYADQEILINKAKTDAILANEQKSAEARMQIAGVTNQSIIDAVKAQMANVAMIQKGGVAGAQGVLGAMDNVFASMAAHNKQAFEAHKALATAQAIISTYQAAAEAIAFPPGPPVSLIYVAGAIAAGMAQVAAIQSQQYSGKAIGGSVMGNNPYIVGEKGPELFTPASSGMITPNDKMGGGQTANINFTIVANDAVGFDALLNTRKGMIKQLVSDAMLDKGQRF
jgi:tape measure domain-containing protein